MLRRAEKELARQTDRESFTRLETSGTLSIKLIACDGYLTYSGRTEWHQSLPFFPPQQLYDHNLLCLMTLDQSLTFSQCRSRSFEPPIYLHKLLYPVTVLLPVYFVQKERDCISFHVMSSSTTSAQCLSNILPFVSVIFIIFTVA